MELERKKRDRKVQERFWMLGVEKRENTGLFSEGKNAEGNDEKQRRA